MNEDLLKRLAVEGVDVEETLERFMDDKEMYIMYLLKFPEEKNMGILKNAIASGDLKAAEGAIHALKGIADNLGLVDFVDAAVDMLYEFRHDNPEGAVACFPAIMDEYNRICALLLA